MSCDIEDGSTSEHEKWEKEAMQENIWKAKSSGSGSPNATSPGTPIVGPGRSLQAFKMEFNILVETRKNILIEV